MNAKSSTHAAPQPAIKKQMSEISTGSIDHHSVLLARDIENLSRAKDEDRIAMLKASIAMRESFIALATPPALSVRISHVAPEIVKVYHLNGDNYLFNADVVMTFVATGWGVDNHGDKLMADRVGGKILRVSNGYCVESGSRSKKVYKTIRGLLAYYKELIESHNMRDIEIYLNDLTVDLPKAIGAEWAAIATLSADSTPEVTPLTTLGEITAEDVNFTGTDYSGLTPVAQATIYQAKLARTAIIMAVHAYNNGSYNKASLSKTIDGYRFDSLNYSGESYNTKSYKTISGALKALLKHVDLPNAAIDFYINQDQLSELPAKLPEVMATAQHAELTRFTVGSKYIADNGTVYTISGFNNDGGNWVNCYTRPEHAHCPQNYVTEYRQGVEIFMIKQPCGELITTVRADRPAPTEPTDPTPTGSAEEVAPVATTKRLEILNNSLAKKQAKLDARIAAQYARQAETNGQPLNDKRNGQSTMNALANGERAIFGQFDEIRKTEAAIKREADKIEHCKNWMDEMPQIIKDMAASGEIVQWRKHPQYFFVNGVDKGRFSFQDGRVFGRYLSDIPADQYPLFQAATSKILRALKGDSEPVAEVTTLGEITAEDVNFTDGDWDTTPTPDGDDSHHDADIARWSAILAKTGLHGQNRLISLLCSRDLGRGFLQPKDTNEFTQWAALELQKSYPDYAIVGNEVLSKLELLGWVRTCERDNYVTKTANHRFVVDFNRVAKITLAKCPLTDADYQKPDVLMAVELSEINNVNELVSKINALTVDSTPDGSDEPTDSGNTPSGHTTLKSAVSNHFNAAQATKSLQAYYLAFWRGLHKANSCTHEMCDSVVTITRLEKGDFAVSAQSQPAAPVSEMPAPDWHTIIDEIAISDFNLIDSREWADLISESEMRFDAELEIERDEMAIEDYDAERALGRKNSLPVPRFELLATKQPAKQNKARKPRFVQITPMLFDTPKVSTTDLIARREAQRKALGDRLPPAPLFRGI